MTTPEVCVARGAAWLDVMVPHWEKRIDLEMLELTDGRCCVVAQLSGELTERADRNYMRVVQQLWGPYPGAGEVARRFGFESSDECAYWRLEEAWREEIAARLADVPA